MKRNRVFFKSFTLIELLVVVAIIAVLVGQGYSGRLIHRLRRGDQGIYLVSVAEKISIKN